jgi:hypothetical protein
MDNMTPGRARAVDSQKDPTEMGLDTPVRALQQ